MNSCLIIAGEKSGEEHAMSFFPELRKLCQDTKFFGVGGEALASHGVEILYHLKDFSSMGFSEVIGKIPFYFKALKRLENEVIKRGTKTAILIDFQDFNMRLAKRLSKRGVKILYYVAPQAWVWKPKRAEVLSRTVHTLFAILPFEKKWFKDRGVNQVRSIPHPLMLTYKEEFKTIPAKPFGIWKKDKLKLLILPGSRKFEIQFLLPVFIKTTQILKKIYPLEVHLVKVPHIPDHFYSYYQNDIDVWYDSTDLIKAMNTCHVCLAASGTVTVSTGLFELPTVVAYRGSLLNEFIYNEFVQYTGAHFDYQYDSRKNVFPEFIQNQVDADKFARVIRSWIDNETVYNELKASLKETKNLLSGEDFSVPQYMSQVIHE